MALGDNNACWHSPCALMDPVSKDNAIRAGAVVKLGVCVAEMQLRVENQK